MDRVLGTSHTPLFSYILMDYFLFFRVLEECRKAKSDLECSLYNSERRKKPVTCSLKVNCSLSQFCHMPEKLSLQLFLFFPFFIHLSDFVERTPGVSPALPAANQEKAAAPRLSDPLSSSPPTRNQKSKCQQPN